MSLTKQALPESVDVTDPRDTGEYLGEDLTSNDVATGWAIFELTKAASFLNANAYSLTVGDLQEISKATLQLQNIPRKVSKPF